MAKFPSTFFLLFLEFKMSKTMPKDPQSPETNIDGSQGDLIFAGPGSNLVSESAEMDKIRSIFFLVFFEF